MMDENNNLVMVHLSDVHCGSKFQGKILQKAIDEINALAPDVIVVTGDLTEDGLFEEYQEANRYLRLLQCRHIVIGSGNHDARTTGYRLFPDFFGEPTKVTEIKDTAIITLNSSRPDQDGGEIGYRQRVWLRECLDKYKDKFKIVSFHHHLMPIPDTGMEKNMISDSGDVLWTLVSHDADVILCGHRHRPWSWSTGNLRIFYSGAVSTNRLRGFYLNSYNIIRIRNDQLKASLKIVGQEEVSLNPRRLKELKQSSAVGLEPYYASAMQRNGI